MKKSGKIIAVVVAMVTYISLGFGASAQELSFGADIVSSYVWRGEKLGNVSFQPAISAEYKGLSLTAWGSRDFTGDVMELDLTAAYCFGRFSLEITDYYATSGENIEPYFKYKAGNGHVFEATAAYTFGEKIPLTLSWNTYFAGTDDTYKSQDYSTYIEAAYSFTLWTADVHTEVGITPWKGAYADRLNVVNIGIGASKSIPITNKFSLPISTKVIFNPAANKAFIVFGLSI